VVSDREPGKLIVSWPVTSFKGTLTIVFTDHRIALNLAAPKGARWHLHLVTANSAELPFVNISEEEVSAMFQGVPYRLSVLKGSCAQTGDTFSLAPENGSLLLDL
ncbi:MAG TPA: hypothetical protein VHC47_11975, partial [Mucilaginibacter sp.]|nr:hypothetical protein [Mucilaginibacter sp.]